MSKTVRERFETWATAMGFNLKKDRYAFGSGKEVYDNPTLELAWQAVLVCADRAPDCLCDLSDDLTIPGGQHHRSCPQRHQERKV